jgi:hypothetical protein
MLDKTQAVRGRFRAREASCYDHDRMEDEWPDG